MLRHPTYYPFVFVAQHAAGQSLEPLVRAPEYENKIFGSSPLLDVSASYDADNDRGAVFIVNRSQTETVTTDVVWQGTAPTSVHEIYQLAGSDPKAFNTFEQPDTISPKRLDGVQVRDGRITLQLPPLSFTVVPTSGYGEKGR